jgi:hypothetical protein
VALESDEAAREVIGRRLRDLARRGVTATDEAPCRVLIVRV